MPTKRFKDLAGIVKVYDSIVEKNAGYYPGLGLVGHKISEKLMDIGYHIIRIDLCSHIHNIAYLLHTCVNSHFIYYIFNIEKYVHNHSTDEDINFEKERLLEFMSDLVTYENRKWIFEFSDFEDFFKDIDPSLRLIKERFIEIE